ncbi:hypothetical protein K470DRAFT_154182 [Piedraia hortae CBS 480.64]|uniref:Uncharacterized protein n=1 Tax=Piedraia hortae CBS 480.64 TaxID=1314780 RepID=A0A6A7C5T4_9PEZI|nr:hypothetical protein K470DRAFT_154182 [Piedraia hortae CBS 480.64]
MTLSCRLSTSLIARRFLSFEVLHLNPTVLHPRDMTPGINYSPLVMLSHIKGRQCIFKRSTARLIQMRSSGHASSWLLFHNPPHKRTHTIALVKLTRHPFARTAVRREHCPYRCRIHRNHNARLRLIRCLPVAAPWMSRLSLDWSHPARAPVPAVPLSSSSSLQLRRRRLGQAGPLVYWLQALQHQHRCRRTSHRLRSLRPPWLL